MVSYEYLYGIYEYLYIVMVGYWCVIGLFTPNKISKFWKTYFLVVFLIQNFGYFWWWFWLCKGSVGVRILVSGVWMYLVIGIFCKNLFFKMLSIPLFSRVWRWMSPYRKKGHSFYQLFTVCLEWFFTSLWVVFQTNTFLIHTTPLCKVFYLACLISFLSCFSQQRFFGMNKYTFQCINIHFPIISKIITHSKHFTIPQTHTQKYMISKTNIKQA